MLTRISTDQIKDILKEKDLRVTFQRVLIFQELYNSIEHPTAEMIFEKLKVEHPMISLGTVYKTLDCFYQAGLLRKLKVNDDVVHYDADLNLHTHIYQKNSNQIIDYHDDELNKLLSDYFKGRQIDNYKITDFELNMFGEIVN